MFDGSKVLRYAYIKINSSYSSFQFCRLDWLEPVEESVLEDFELLAATEVEADGKRKGPDSIGSKKMKV